MMMSSFPYSLFSVRMPFGRDFHDGSFFTSTSETFSRLNDLNRSC